MMLVLVIDPSVYIIIHQEGKPGAHLTKSLGQIVILEMDVVLLVK